MRSTLSKYSLLPLKLTKQEHTRSKILTTKNATTEFVISSIAPEQREQVSESEDPDFSPWLLSKPEEILIPSGPELEERTQASRTKLLKQKTDKQLERARERQRRSRQVKRTIKSDKQATESTQRIFYQWEYQEVRNMLYKQRIELELAHEAELLKMTTLFKELETRLRAVSAHSGMPQPLNQDLLKALLLLDKMDDGVFWALQSLVGRVPGNSELHCKSTRYSTSKTRWPMSNLVIVQEPRDFLDHNLSFSIEEMDSARDWEEWDFVKRL